MPRRSLYHADYLHDVRWHLMNGHLPATPGSYLTRVLRGKAKQYADRYLRVLLAGLRADPEVVPILSAGGREAFVRLADLSAPRECRPVPEVRS